MPNPLAVERATQLLLDRPDLSVVEPLDAFLGDQPSLDRLTEAALALAHPDIFNRMLAALIHDSSGTELDRNPARVIVNYDPDGNRQESLHAIPIAQGRSWNARVHVWGEGQPLTDDIHNHTADFGSAVLAGNFQDQMMYLAPHGQGISMFDYLRDGSQEPVGEVTMRPGEQRVIPAGSYHMMDHTAIHSANVVPVGVAATVVVRSQVTSFSNGYTEGLRQGSHPWTEPVDARETMQRLQATLSSL